ncbi:hypothetical protein PBY51_002915 [Eleginops maclovinus]|uniref:Adhesion G-protein coupled receptor G4 n=1 Tax=Eleginops maclovinus TaxID=56733 RepID=A0AAN7XB25_ELEMC|nr:hypothetical protein PBY51_002915 [Eleginops maclovinus]
MEQVSRLSLWGEVIQFTNRCSHWTLNPQVSIPALQELTVCFNLKFETDKAASSWTAFMYSHPELQTELGLAMKERRLLVWLFGTEWSTTRRINLRLSRWYSLCLTWKYKGGLALYIDGKHEKITADTPPPISRKLAPNGMLTLGASGSAVNRNITSPAMVGKLSLFRLWGRERSEHDVTSLRCIEGDIVKWESDNWYTPVCAVFSDSSLECEWSVYEVRLMFHIIRLDGKNNTELYTARDIAHTWLRKVLPSTFFLNRVSVFEVPRSRKKDSFVNERRLVEWSPFIKSFDCLVHVNVIPSLNVATVKNMITEELRVIYDDPNGKLKLHADSDSIHSTPVESFSAVTIIPPGVVTAPSPVSTITFKTITSLKTTSTTTSVSTTEASVTALTTNTPPNISELYFEVKVNISLTGDSDPGQTVSTWLNSSLPDDMMTVLDLQLLPKTQRRQSKLQSNLYTTNKVFVPSVSRESCIFQVWVMMSQLDTQEIETQIRHLLLTPYNNGSVSIATEDIQISRILITNCNAETHLTMKGLFAWPDTQGGKNASQPCPKNPLSHATRQCKLCLSTHWLASDQEDCGLVVETIPDLDHVEVTAENALDVVEMIEDLLRDHSTLNYQELATVLNKLEDIVNLSRVTPSLGQALINIISDILESDSNLVPFTNTILNITEAVGDKMVGYEGSFTLVAPYIAISVVDVVPGEFSSLTFGVSSDRAGNKPEIFINRYPFNETVAFIFLPSVLQHSFPQNSSTQSPPRVKFQFFGIPMLFKNSQSGHALNTFVVSASVTNASSPIKDLDEDVKVTLHHLIPNTLDRDVQCVYWNFNKNNGHGGWDDDGCMKYNCSSQYTTCLCDHLTHFGVLLDVSRTPLDPANEQILTIITYVGCGVSSVFLGITVLTYTVFEKLRRDYPSQILIHLSLALLGLNLVFLVNSWLSSWGLYGLCVAVASTMHYFLLASFTWMGLEAVNMYFALVKVFNVYVPSYILKFCSLGWGIPLVICILVLIMNREAYGSHLYTNAQHSLKPALANSDDFCWLQDDLTFYVSVVAYAALVFLFNIAVFVVVLIQIRQMRVNRPAGIRSGLMHDLKGVTSITLLLGLTWTVGFFTVGPARVVLLYLFTGLNTLQGLFIFLFHCLMKENVRKQWRIHLCFGRFRLDEFSDYSNSGSVGVTAKPKSNPPKAPVPSLDSVKSSSTDSTSASSDSSQRDSSFKRPNLGLFMNSLALPRAQNSTSVTGALPSPRGENPTPGWRNHLLGQQEKR